MIKNNNQVALIVFILSLFGALFVLQHVDRKWQEQSYVYQNI